MLLYLPPPLTLLRFISKSDFCSMPRSDYSFFNPPLKLTYGCRLPFKKKFLVFFSFKSRTSEFTSLGFVSGVFLFPTNQEESRRSPLEGLISVLPGLDQGCISLMKHQPHGSESSSCMLRSRAYRVSGKRVM